MGYVTMTASALTAVPRITKPGKTTMDPARKLALFEQTVIPHLNAAYNLARWLTRNGHDAEDLVQESYLRAFRSFDAFQGTDGRAWLLAVVRNTCFTWLRKKGGQPTVEFDEQMHSEAGESSDAESILLNQAALGSLQDCLEALPLEFREVIVLRELEELSYKEISDIARVPIGTVMSRLARGRKRLQQCLAGALR
jgi:RNA polymerase sigma-70 factor (ECF subfamily)